MIRIKQNGDDVEPGLTRIRFLTQVMARNSLQVLTFFSIDGGLGWAKITGVSCFDFDEGRYSFFLSNEITFAEGRPIISVEYRPVSFFQVFDRPIFAPLSQGPTHTNPRNGPLRQVKCRSQTRIANGFGNPNVVIGKLDRIKIFQGFVAGSGEHFDVRIFGIVPLRSEDEHELPGV